MVSNQSKLIKIDGNKKFVEGGLDNGLSHCCAQTSCLQGYLTVSNKGIIMPPSSYFVSR